MKINAFCLVMLVLFLQGCGEEHVFDPQFTDAESNAKVKFIHAASDTVGVNLFVGGIKLTGNTASTISTFGSVNIGKVNIGSITYSNSFPVSDYGFSDGGSLSLVAIVPATFTATLSYPEKTLVSKNSTLTAGKFHTVALVGVSPNYELLVFEDNLPVIPLDGKIYLKFGNFINNLTDPVKVVITPPATTEDPTPIPITLFQGVLYKEMKDFVSLPRRGTYKDLQIINETTSAVIYTLTPTTSTFYVYVDNKVYTLFLRGKIGGTGTAAPQLGRVTNR